MIIILCFNDKRISSTRSLFKCLFSRKSFLEQAVSSGCSSKVFFVWRCRMTTNQYFLLSVSQQLSEAGGSKAEKLFHDVLEDPC